MSWLWLSVVAILLSAFARWLFNYCLTLYHLPPGPWGLPVLGYLPWLSQQVFVDFARIGKQYGGLFSVGIGTEQIVVLNDWPALKATLIDQGKVFSGRKFNHVANLFAGGTDIIFGQGKVWRKQRNLAVQSLKNVGFNSTKTLESRLTETILGIVDQVKKFDGQVADIEHVLHDNIATGNWSLLSSIRVTECQEDLDAVKRDIDIFIHTMRLNNPVAAFSWLRFLPPDGFGFWKCSRAMDRFRVYLRTLIRKHREQIDSENDVIDNYIRHIDKNPDRKPPYNDEHLVGTVSDLLAASVETTFTASLWGLLYLVLNPHVQVKAQEELDLVVGRERVVTVDDFKHLPYLDAFVMESHRLGSVAPLSAPHATMDTARVNGFTIPKNTVCLPNIYAIHRDPDYWDEPEAFRPERFITEDGSAKAPPYFVPFSVGPRMCLGLFMAEIEMRLLFACLLQNFTFSLPQGQPKPSLDPVIAFTRRPKPFSMRVTCRN